jgi:hypothetical protein
MSRHPSQATASRKAVTSASPADSPSAVTNPTEDKVEKKVTTARAKKPVGKNQKEVVVELAALKGKGYPAAMNLDTGAGKPAPTVAEVRPVR